MEGLSSAFLVNTGKQDPPNFTWVNVAVASAFLLINGIISRYLRLKLEVPLFLSALRCLVQLTVMGLILKDVFSARNPYYVALMTAALILLSTYETVYDKAERSWHGMVMSVLISTAFSTLLVGVIGTRWALLEEPFWIPEIFIPTIGLLMGITASSMAVALNSCLGEMATNEERVEALLAFGADRYEAGRAIATEAVRVSMLPNINRMSIVGLITIPGTMTGQILGGAPIMNAVRYQQIIQFMITASCGLAVLGVVVLSMHAVIDRKHRLRTERTREVKVHLKGDIKLIFGKLWQLLKIAVYKSTHCCHLDSEGDDDDNERRPLLRN